MATFVWAVAVLWTQARRQLFKCIARPVKTTSNWRGAAGVVVTFGSQTLSPETVLPSQRVTASSAVLLSVVARSGMFQNMKTLDCHHLEHHRSHSSVSSSVSNSSSKTSVMASSIPCRQSWETFGRCDLSEM